MTESRLDDDAFDDLLRRSAPGPLPDAGFSARTMAEVERAARAQPVQRRPAPPAPLAIARALAAEQRRHDAQARLWRWAIAGVAAGAGTVMVTLSVLLSIGAIWIAVREWRAA